MRQSLFNLFIRPLLSADLSGRLKARATSYDDLFTHDQDGTARYDDVWGAPCDLEQRGR